jgi:predicted dehydrogenase
LPWTDIYGDGFTPDCAPSPYLEPGRRSYSDPAIAGGGQIYTQVSHAAAYVTFLTGRQATEVFARFDNTGADVDVYNVINVKLEGGTIVGITSTGATRKTKRMLPVAVYGTEGVLHLELFEGTMTFQKMSGETRHYPRLDNGDVYPMGKPVENLIDLVLGRGTNRSPGVLGLAAMKIVDGACRSARENSNIRIPWW